MIYNLNKEAYKRLYDKGKADIDYKGAEIALKQVELSQEELYKVFKDITLKSDFKIFVVNFKDPMERIKQIVKINKDSVEYG